MTSGVVDMSSPSRLFILRMKLAGYDYDWKMRGACSVHDEFCNIQDRPRRGEEKSCFVGSRSPSDLDTCFLFIFHCHCGIARASRTRSSASLFQRRARLESTWLKCMHTLNGVLFWPMPGSKRVPRSRPRPRPKAKSRAGSSPKRGIYQWQ